MAKDCKDNQSLFADLEKIEHGTLVVAGICTAIASYGKYAEVVATLVKEIRDKTYEYHDEMVMMSMQRGFGEERFVNAKVCKLLWKSKMISASFRKLLWKKKMRLWM